MSASHFGKLGQDVITGFQGIVIGYVQYSTGCNQYLLAPRVDEKGAKVDSEWFDEQRISFPSDEVVVSLDNGATPGFDKAPARR